MLQAYLVSFTLIKILTHRQTQMSKSLNLYIHSRQMPVEVVRENQALNFTIFTYLAVFLNFHFSIFFYMSFNAIFLYKLSIDLNFYAVLFFHFFYFQCPVNSIFNAQFSHNY